jgi:arylsulfatase A-like enzyme
MSDDHAAHAISAYGSRINKTPNIDRLAIGGMKLNNCFCTNSICTPSRAAILTGQYSHKNGVYTLNDKLDGSRNNVAKELQAAGYQTAMIGKWHLVNTPTGFDHWNILPGQGAYYDPEFITPAGRKKYTGYCTDLIGDFSLEWLKGRDKTKPFFLMCHHKAPHRPWQPSPKYAKLFEGIDIPEPDNLLDKHVGMAASPSAVKMRVGEDTTKTDLKVDRPLGPDGKTLEGEALKKWAYQLYIKDYLRCVQSVDDNVGRVLDYLEAEKLAENTLVIYTSDQGFFLGDHGFFDKRLMYEESLRMPLLARLPGVTKAGSVSDEMVLNVDFAATFLELAGRAKPAEMQGRSFGKVLAGGKAKEPRKAVYYRYWMHNDGDHHVPGHYGVRTKDYKLIYYYGKPLGMTGAFEPATAPEWEFFDLRKDKREMTNRYSELAYQGVIAKLKVELARLQKEVGDTAA